MSGKSIFSIIAALFLSLSITRENRGAGLKSYRSEAARGKILPILFKVPTAM